jgi:hypothetical protein
MLATTSAHPEPQLAGSRLYGLYWLALTVCLVGNLMIRIGAEAGWLPRWGQVTLAGVSVAPLIVAVAFFWRLLRGDLDEMLQRVVLEGLAMAFVLYVPLAALYVNLHTAGVWVPRLDAPDIVMTPALLAAIGIWLAFRRYQ